MNEQLPPQSIEEQIRYLDGLFASIQNEGNQVTYQNLTQESLRQAMESLEGSPGVASYIQVHPAGLPVMTAEQIVDHALSTGVTITTTTTTASELGWMQGDTLKIIDGTPYWEPIDKVTPKKKNFFDLLTITRDE